MARSTEAVINAVRTRIHTLLFADVIPQTIVVMSELQREMGNLSGIIRSGNANLRDEEKEDLKETLLQLTSESIREALHKGELPITNSIIRSKNQILTALGEPIPESHQEIDPKKYPNYNW